MVAVVGRPNVGKSSLVNALVGTKVGIVAPKPQTTRHRLYGVLNRAELQIVFIDTPGLHHKAQRALNQAMNHSALGALEDVDAVVLVVEAGRWNEDDELALSRVAAVRAPLGLAINKIDRFADKTRLLPEIERLRALAAFGFVVPLAAAHGENLEPLVAELATRMPEGPPLYPPGQSVGHDLRFAAAEIVREKLIRALAQELPYALTVESESIEQQGPVLKISALIWVERESQKKIVIGENGAMLKRIGTAARRELEALTGAHVHLKLWARAKENWSDDPAALRRFGYRE
ncbi:MAG: GTPase Era [Gammaproteobacteria bacterium]|nr:GTPase Era [Gammaproteobacteria bacterium]